MTRQDTELGFEIERDHLLEEFDRKVHPIVERYWESRDGRHHVPSGKYADLQKELEPFRKDLERSIRRLKEKYSIL